MAGTNIRALQDRFTSDELEWRLQQAGEKNGRIWAICVPYVNNRAIQQRLDDVVGPENWRNEFAKGPEGGVLCGISLRVGDEWVTKWDGAENTDIEGVKGGLSASMKRAAVQWGIGRYLYGLEETFAQVSRTGRLRGRTKQGTEFRWDPPRLPAWALPAPAAEAPARDPLLEFVRNAARDLADDAVLTLSGTDHPLKPYLRDHWPEIRADAGLAQAVLQAVETATGQRFILTRAA